MFLSLSLTFFLSPAFCPFSLNCDCKEIMNDDDDVDDVDDGNDKNANAGNWQGLLCLLLLFVNRVHQQLFSALAD